MKTFHKFAVASALTLMMGVSSVAFGETTGQYLDDTAITTKVKAALVSDQLLDATRVSVTTNQGAVQLTGAVANKAQETAAVRDANQVTGVKAVQDQLQIRGTQNP